jgi:hypothetical protein
LTLRHQPAALTSASSGNHPCPYCNQDLPEGFDAGDDDRWETVTDTGNEIESFDTDPAYQSRASDYFQLLAIANDRSSRTPEPSTPLEQVHTPRSRHRNKEKGRATSPSPEEYRSEKAAFPADKMAEGYFKTFFEEECKLGMGASGSVFLCKV